MSEFYLNILFLNVQTSIAQRSSCLVSVKPKIRIVLDLWPYSTIKMYYTYIYM